MREIVAPVGMLPGSLYCHFATKEALLVAVYREGVERIGAAVDAAVAPFDDPWQRLEAACVAHLDTLLDQSDYSQVVIRVRPSDAPAAEAELVRLRNSYEKRYARLVAALPLDRAHRSQRAAPDAAGRAQLEPDVVSTTPGSGAGAHRTALRRAAEVQPGRRTEGGRIEKEIRMSADDAFAPGCW